MELLLATRSADKLREIEHILGGLRVLHLDDAGVARSDDEESLERFETFEENARSKAEYFHEQTGLATVADDSGLEVDALDGAPGVRSKRFAPTRGLSGRELRQANNEYLLERLGDLEPERRTARYVCAAVLVGAGPEAIVTRGEAAGRILTAPRGDSGFGYDPYFFDVELALTFAQLGLEEKNRRSHRGKAFRALAEILRAEDG